MDKTGTITTSDNDHVQLNAQLNDTDRELVYNVCMHSNHPLSRMICRYLGSHKRLQVTGLTEAAGRGITASVNGYQVRIGSEQHVSGYSKDSSAGTKVHVSVDGNYRGYFAFAHQYREGLKKINNLEQDYKLYLLSGDQDHERFELIRFFKTTDNLFFNQSPQDKLDFIGKLQQQGAKVMMIGDGLNDAGALKQSDLGIAVTDNVNNFSPGSDAIMDGRSFGRLPAFLQFSKDTVRIIHTSFLISLTYNFIGLSYAVTGKLSPLFAAILMPVSTVTIISFTSLATHFAAKKRQLS
jgi:Cu+-exporting ATPase